MIAIYAQGNPVDQQRALNHLESIGQLLGQHGRGAAIIVTEAATPNRQIASEVKAWSLSVEGFVFGLFLHRHAWTSVFRPHRLGSTSVVQPEAARNSQ